MVNYIRDQTSVAIYVISLLANKSAVPLNSLGTMLNVLTVTNLLILYIHLPLKLTNKSTKSNTGFGVQ